MRTIDRLSGEQPEVLAMPRVGRIIERGHSRALIQLGAVLSTLVCLLLLLLGQEAQARPMVITTIPVGPGASGVGVNPTTNRIYVANNGSNIISVIDGATNTVVFTIPVAAGPAGVGVNPITNRIYVSHSHLPLVTVINGAANTVLTTTSTAPAEALSGVAVNTATNRIYVTSFDPGGRIVVIDGDSNTLHPINLAANPISVGVNPTTNRVYVGHGSFFGRTQPTIIDGATEATSDGPVVGLAPAFIGVNPVTNRIYMHLGALSNYKLVVLEGNCNVVDTTIDMLAGDGGVGVNPNTNRIYVANNTSNKVSVIDGNTNTVVETISVGQTPTGVAVNPNTQRVYVTNYVDGTVSVIEDTGLADPGLIYAKVIDENNQPVTGARVYHNGQWVTNASGELQVTNLAGNVSLVNVQPGDTLVTLAPLYQQPTVRQGHENWAYQIYKTSLSVAGDGSLQPSIVITPTGPQTLTVKPDNTLILFNLVVSIEWDATEAYLQDVELAVRRAANFLHDVTDGQMTLGQVTIYDRAEYWTDADLQISAKNVVHPHAYIGGIIDDDKSHLIRVGRFWDGNSGNQGAWSLDNGFKTLVHEFGHYGLSLYDEYFGYDVVGGELVGQHEAFCTGPENQTAPTPLTGASIMDFHYKTSELADAGRWTTWCQQTAQHQLNQGEADWQTLLRYYGDGSGQNRWHLVTPDQRVGVGNAVPGPTAVSPALPFPTVISNNTGISPVTFTLEVCQDDLPYDEGAWVTLHLGNGRAMDQGLTDALGRLDILGARPGDSLKVVTLDGLLWGETLAPPEGCLDLSALAPAALSSEAGPYLRLWPTTSGGLLDGLRLVLTRTLPTDTLTYALTGPDNIGPSAAIPYNSASNDHRVQVNFIPAALAGQAKVLGAHAGQFFDLNVDYRLQRMTNTHDTDLFSNDGNLALHLETGALPLNEVYFLIASPWGLPGPLPSGLDIIGEAYEITAANDVTNLEKPAVLVLHYDVAAGSAFESLGIYRWDFQAATWQPLGGEINSKRQEVVATITDLGLYTLLGIPANTFIYLPVVIKH